MLFDFFLFLELAADVSPADVGCSIPWPESIIALSDVQLFEGLAELLDARDLLAVVTQEDPRARHPVLLQGNDGTKLVLEDVTVALGQYSTKAVLLTWAASLPVLHRKLPQKGKQLAAVLYRYGLGVEVGPKLNVAATKAINGLLCLKGIVHIEGVFEMTKIDLTNYADNASDIHFSLKFLKLLTLEETHI